MPRLTLGRTTIGIALARGSPAEPRCSFAKKEMMPYARLSHSVSKCGLAVVDLRNGRTVALLEFQSAIEEIFDVQLLQGLRFPEVMGFQSDSLDHTFVVPPEAER